MKKKKKYVSFSLTACQKKKKLEKEEEKLNFLVLVLLFSLFSDSGSKHTSLTGTHLSEEVDMLPGSLFFSELFLQAIHDRTTRHRGAQSNNNKKWDLCQI